MRTRDSARGCHSGSLPCDGACAQGTAPELQLNRGEDNALGEEVWCESPELSGEPSPVFDYGLLNSTNAPGASE